LNGENSRAKVQNVREDSSAGHLERLANPKWSLRDPIGECQAFDHLHDECGDSGRVFEAVNVGDVGMVERREDSRFALKSGEPFRIAGELIGQTLIATSRLSFESRAR
jgi:hypothetical protein